MFERFSDPQAWVALAALMALEIVLGIDNIIFSLDSVISAVGLVEHLSIMVIAVAASVGVMLLAAKPIREFVDNNPTIKMLAMTFSFSVDA